ncbi:hypothetical protein HTZ77_39905 [Nonomuraea sp. SMC257]|uniref:Uncharacterized protein n=1 Tax=Nonomuraea montanisoli TaxID=2741721 RepID=A0A7Y6IH24_9ACTN|nr:hypothetical protein [Nonomuraea montanisoli]NUW37523.1 hypothetical protein [Nonomuraea montanisoli]
MTAARNASKDGGKVGDGEKVGVAGVSRKSGAWALGVGPTWASAAVE